VSLSISAGDWQTLGMARKTGCKRALHLPQFREQYAAPEPRTVKTRADISCISSDACPSSPREELEEMESLNPKSAAEIRQPMEEEEFLKGGGDKPSAAPANPHKHSGGHWWLSGVFLARRWCLRSRFPDIRLRMKGMCIRWWAQWPPFHENHLEVKATDGKASTVTLNEKTKILRGKVKATSEDIKPGERIVVTATETKGKDGKTTMIAIEVRLLELVASK
jgi:hypothetical protein